MLNHRIFLLLIMLENAARFLVSSHVPYSSVRVLCQNGLFIQENIGFRHFFQTLFQKMKTTVTCGFSSKMKLQLLIVASWAKLNNSLKSAYNE